ncbi:MAG: OB-fold nucleic acid binding domain-containing protein, partial [Legionellales bacterium]
MYTHYCTAVNESDLNKEISVCGWVHHRRDHGGVVFLDIRDSSGILQVVYEPENQNTFTIAEKLRSEFVVKITGIVRKRPDGMINNKMETGTVEVIGTKLEILNQSPTPPFLPDDHQMVNEDLRYKYRY